MGEKNNAKSPLLYIHQPTVRTPEAPMQSRYMTPKKKKKAKSKEDGNAVKRPVGRDYFVEKSADNQQDAASEAEPVETDEKAVEDKSEETNGERKQFKDMTIRERIDYFLNTPEHVPAMRCVISTDERRYRGIIADFQDETVYLRRGKRTAPAKIAFDYIQDIRMIGF